MENIYQKVMDSLEENQAVAIQTTIEGESGLIAEGIHRGLTPVVPVADLKGRRFARVGCEKLDNSYAVSEPILPQERLIVLGGGHIALPVCQFGARCGFSVYVCDDRPDFANRRRFPEAEAVICDSFENSIESLKITAFDYVVIITRGHRHDADCLRAILPGVQPAYLGMIGSRRRTTGLLQMLQDEGYAEDRLKKICTPIGLDIGAVTPGEIAISILSEVISYKRLSKYGDENRYCNDSDVELSTIKYLAENNEPKSIVTVIETKGSTPRGTGAKMAVSPLGQVTGSIGGGCSEAAVIQDAVRIIGTGRYKIVDIDLTGEVAESDGMVCGGTMKVLVEDGSGQ